MPSPARQDRSAVFASLADIVRQGSTLPEVYAAICVAATLTVPGCDHASLMISRGGTRRTAAVSDDVARQIDRMELALGIGPCIDAMESRRAEIEPDLAAASRWPALTARVVSQTPVRGAMSVRLPVDRENIGALNLFSDAPHAFDASSVEQAVVLAAFATVASTAAAHNEDVATLRRGLTTNRAIGQAIGMLMTLNDLTDAAAFDVLRQASQNSNVKLVDVATEVIRGRGQRDTGKSA